MLHPNLTPERVSKMRRLGHWPDLVLTDLLDRWAAERPDGIAVVDHNSVTGERNELTFGVLADRVNRLAGSLLRLGTNAVT